MNGVDYIILSVAFVSLFVGYKRGFIREFSPLLNLIVAILVAFFPFDIVARFLNEYNPARLRALIAFWGFCLVACVRLW